MACADYGRPLLQGLREDLRRATFWKGVDEPEPQALIADRLLRCTSGGSVDVSDLQKRLLVGVNARLKEHRGIAGRRSVQGAA